MCAPRKPIASGDERRDCGQLAGAFSGAPVTRLEGDRQVMCCSASTPIKGKLR